MRARGTVALASALALAAAAPLLGRPTAFAQDAASSGATAGTPAPTGTPGGGEVEPRPGPPVALAPGIEPAPSVDVGPEIADPGMDPDLGDAIEGGLGEGSDEVAVPDLGVAGEPVGGAEDLDPEASPFDGLDTDPLGLDPGADLGRLDPLFEPRRERGRRSRPALGRASERGPGGLTLAFGVGLTLRAEDNPDLRDATDDGETVLAAELSASAC